jgi:hypothetical protein
VRRRALDPGNLGCAALVAAGVVAAALIGIGLVTVVRWMVG